MLTRRMAEELQSLVDNLSAQLREQQLQIEARENTQANTSNANRMPVAQNASPQSRFDASKIPNAIKMIVTYNGDPKSLPNWIVSIDSKLDFAKTPEDEENALPLWQSVIQDKVVDKANEVLIQNHTPVEWGAIKKTLEDHFGDKRDLCTLVTKISHVQPNSKSIDDFYNECRSILSDISSKIMLDPDMKLCAKTLTAS